MRIILIPGFGEEEFIFGKLHPLLTGEKLFLNFWTALPNRSRPELNAALFASELVQQYNITCTDVVIGHSAGGWVALFIKQQVHCPVVQIASWTDKRKLTMPSINRHLLYLVAKTGLYFNSFLLRRFLKKYYQGKPSAAVFETVFTRLIEGDRENRVNQLRLISNPVKEPLVVKPDLRIHAKSDSIVRLPNDSFHEVPGDHFSLYTHPDAVAQPIISFLQNHGGS